MSSEVKQVHKGSFLNTKQDNLKRANLKFQGGPVYMGSGLHGTFPVELWVPLQLYTVHVRMSRLQ